jgi:hypothetical protein
MIDSAARTDDLWGISQPFDTPVVPEVKRITAVSSSLKSQEKFELD